MGFNGQCLSYQDLVGVQLAQLGISVLDQKSIFDHMAYQPIKECFKNNRVFFRKGAYAEELVKITEALVQAAHDVPSAVEMQVRS